MDIPCAVKCQEQAASAAAVRQCHISAANPHDFKAFADDSNVLADNGVPLSSGMGLAQ